MKKLLKILPAILLLVSCGPSQQEHNEILLQNKELKEEITNLKMIIENYENTPDRLYSSVTTFVNNKDIEGLTNLCNKFEKYHPASTEYQKAKNALNKLIDEKNAKEKAEKEKRMKVVNKLIKNYDDVSGVTWYKNPYFTHYNNTNLVSIYIGQQGNSVWLRLKMSYEGDNWIFFENAYLSYDENTIPVPFDRYENKKTDNGYGGQVWEWIDVPINDDLLSYLKGMVNGKTLKMRLSGKYTHTHTLTTNERKALQDVLLAFDVLENGE